MEKIRLNEDNEHTTIFNGLLYKKNCSEAEQFRVMNDLQKVSNPDVSWRKKDKDERILLAKKKREWKSYVNSLDIVDRPKI